MYKRLMILYEKCSMFIIGVRRYGVCGKKIVELHKYLFDI